MSAPGCTLVLRNRLTDEQVRSFHSWLAPFGTVTPEWKDHCLEIKDAEAEVDVCLYDEVESAYDGGLGPALQHTLGWRPAQIVNISGANSGLVHHVMVGRVACELAERLQALIRLGEICHLDDGDEPDLSDLAERRLGEFHAKLHPEDRDTSEGFFRKVQESGEQLMPVFRDVEEWYDRRVREKASQAPGNFIEIVTKDGHRSYLVDAVYLRHWLKDPNFYIS